MPYQSKNNVLCPICNLRKLTVRSIERNMCSVCAIAQKNAESTVLCGVCNRRLYKKYKDIGYCRTCSFNELRQDPDILRATENSHLNTDEGADSTQREANTPAIPGIGNKYAGDMWEMALNPVYTGDDEK